MGRNIIADFDEFFNIFLLLAGCVRGRGLHASSCPASSDQGYDLQCLAVNADLGEGGRAAKIFILDLQKERFHLVINRREILRCDDDQRRYDGHQGFDFLHKA